MHETFRMNSIAMRLLIVVLFAALTVASFAFSVYLILIAKNIYVVALGFIFVVLSLIAGVYNTITAGSYYRSYFYGKHLEKIKAKLRPMHEYPTVAVIMPTYKEDLAVVEKNMRSMKTLRYESKKIKFYLHDDSKDPLVKKRKRELCNELGFTYITRAENKDFKAGALNNSVAHSEGEFIAIFDADERLIDRNFLLELLPYFQDGSVSFVQSEKAYEMNSLFSEGVDLFNTLFFKFVQPARALHDTAIFAGSCGIVRRSALEDIGGFPKYVTEDAFFSFEADMHGYKSVYVPKIYALGKELSFSELESQQWRYNYGGTQFLFYFLRCLREGKCKDIPLISKVDYFAYGFGMNYLSTFLIIFTLVALLTVFTTAQLSYTSFAQAVNVPFTVVGIEVVGLSSFLLSIIVPVVLTKTYFNSFSKGIMLSLLNVSLAFTRLKGALSALSSLSGLNGWFKGTAINSTSARWFAALRTSAAELTFSGIFLLGGIGAAIAANMSGSLWLLWYGILYTSTFFFYYKYG
jgi:cellulose synthase/poly-beta-1,6-N-acetylglucosamine synthase-like glycosyltransferase